MDGYAAYEALTDLGRAGAPVNLAYCWSGAGSTRSQGGDAPVAEAALQPINALYHVEAMILGHAPKQWQSVPHEQSNPIVDDLRTWLDIQLAKVPRHARIADAIRYAFKLWSGAAPLPGRLWIEIDTNVVERKNALFAGSDRGGVHWGVIASLIETFKLDAVDIQAYLADVLSRLVNRHPATQSDQLMPWANPVA